MLAQKSVQNRRKCRFGRVIWTLERLDLLPRLNGDSIVWEWAQSTAFRAPPRFFGPRGAIRLVRIPVVTRDNNVDPKACFAEQPARSGQASDRRRTRAVTLCGRRRTEAAWQEASRAECERTQAAGRSDCPCVDERKAECRSRGVHSRCHAVTDCSAVRNYTVSGAQGVGGGLTLVVFPFGNRAFLSH